MPKMPQIIDFGKFPGIVATHGDYKRPMIFKTSRQQAHGRMATFEPGFGCSIADAVMASAAAFPYFDRKQVKTTNQGEPELLDGGFVANNPTLFAIADALKAFEIDESQIRVLSIGVGSYPEPKTNWLKSKILRLWPIQLLDTTFTANTNTIEIIRSIMFSSVETVRIDENQADGRYATNLLESDINKLKKILDLGRESFGKHEQEITNLFRQ